MARRLALVAFFTLVSCSASPAEDAGVDAGLVPPDAGEACWSLSPAECAARGCRVIDGQRSTDAGTNPAMLPFIDVGCMPIDQLCGTTITYGHPPDAGDECWQFTDTCMPLGWQRTPGDPRSNPLCPRY